MFLDNRIIMGINKIKVTTMAINAVVKDESKMEWLITKVVTAKATATA